MKTFARKLEEYQHKASGIRTKAYVPKPQRLLASFSFEVLKATRPTVLSHNCFSGLPPTQSFSEYLSQQNSRNFHIDPEILASL